MIFRRTHWELHYLSRGPSFDRYTNTKLRFECVRKYHAVPFRSQPNFYYEFTVNFKCGNDHRSYQLATKTKEATDEWVQAIRVAGFSNLKEKLDAIQMELFKAEFCFGIEQVRCVTPKNLLAKILSLYS